MKQSAKNLGILFLLGLFLLPLACGGLGKKKPVYPAEVDSSMRSAFQTAEGYYSRRNLGLALKEYEKFISAFAYNQLTDEAWYKIGKIHFLQSQWAAAINAFEVLVKKSPDPAYRSKGFLMAGYSAYRYEDHRRALYYLDQAEPEAMSAKLNLRLYSIRALIGEKLGLPRPEIDQALLRMADIYEGGTDPELSDFSAQDLFSKRDVMQRLGAFVTSPLPGNRIPAWFRTYPKTFSKSYVEYKWGKTLVEIDDKQGARRKLSEFVDAYPKHEYSDSARQMLKELGGAVSTAKDKKDKDVLRIGVLLPLSGPQSAYGRTVLNGVECASGVHAGCLTAVGEGMAKVQLIVRDSGTVPEELAKVMDDLEDERVLAIIGPMSGPLAEAASKRAHQIKVPLFPITQKPGINTVGGYVFPMGYPAGQQISDLVSRARHDGRKTFGMLYPHSNYGQEMSELFAREVASQGGKIVAKASYDPSKPDLGSEVRRLKLGQNRFSYTGSTAGFDALFIPDSYRVVNHLIPYLKLSGIEGIPLLGTNAWNDAALSAQLAADYPGSFFLDLFYSASRGGKTPAFVNAFRQAFGRTPNSLEAIGFDAVWFVRQAVGQAGSFKAADIQDALLARDNLGGATGVQSFKGENGAVISPFVLTVGEGGIRELPAK